MLPKISGVEVTPSITSVESSEQFWRKIRQIWRICEPWLNLSKTATFRREESHRCREMAIVETYKQESMYGLSAKKSGHCREVAV